MSSTERAGAWRQLLTQAVVLHEAIAERLGVNATDLKCLELASGEDSLTPTRLAELAGLTTGAVTGVLDRLERAGIARREPDAADRRSVVVRIDPTRAAELAALYRPLLDALAKLTAGLPATTRDAVERTVLAASETAAAETGRLRIAARGGMVGDTYVAPLAGATRGRLIFGSGAPRLTLNAQALGQQARMVMETSASRLTLGGGAGPDELIRAHFDGPAPEVRVSDGVATLRYRRRALDFKSRGASVELNPTIPWTLQVDGGVTDLVADLRGLRLGGLELHGGANHLRLQLPAPDGTVRLVVTGGANRARFERPAGTAASLRVRGGVSHLRFDDQRLDSVSGTLTMRSDDFAGAAERYEIDLSGGASHLTASRG